MPHIASCAAGFNLTGWLPDGMDWRPHVLKDEWSFFKGSGGKKVSGSRLRRQLGRQARLPS